MSEANLDDVLRSLRYHVEAALESGIDRLPEATQPPADGSAPAAPPPPPPGSTRPRAKGVMAPEPDRSAPSSGAGASSLFDSVKPEQRAAAVGPDAAAALAELSAKVTACTLCKLHKQRTRAVFGEGPADARLMFVGEGPGADEDRQGRPFVGRAGQLLNNIIKAMGLAREQVYIANVVKCRPPGNRTPERDEVLRCLPYLEAQIETIRPAVICALGSPAMRTLLDISTPITRARGKVYRYGSIRVVPTFHPAYLLRNPSAKPTVWEDIKLVMRLLKDG